MQGEKARKAFVLEGGKEEERGAKARPNAMGSSPTRPRLAVPPPADVAVPRYSEMAPNPEALAVPVRTFGPEATRKRPPLRKRFDVATEQAIAHMHLCVVKAFDVERRDDSAVLSSGAGSAWPFPVRFERSTDYAPGSVVLKPARPSSAEIQFRNDVLDLVIELAKEDQLGAKLVSGRALRTEWDVLQRHDQLQRKRWQLDKLRRAALKWMVDRDRAKGSRLIDRLHTLFLVNTFPFAKHTDRA
jgi:hypothetical protein